MGHRTSLTQIKVGQSVTTGHRGASATRVRTTVAVIVTLALLLGLRLWVVEPLIVSSNSMEPTVLRGSIIFLMKTSPSADAFTAGRLVVFQSPKDGHTTIKRVIAVGGQRVDIRDAILYVDGARVSEPFVDHSRIDGTYFGPVTVPAGHVFVLGDNRAVSIDSREFGAVPLDNFGMSLLWPHE
ncbi:signal peptidase I [Cryobacterium lyxosi]|uniref:Signal peptidase I n=1 Tax=Cryobacterium lyxosi TaxID=1259228 RepID=A0A4R8ZLA0_9MICO|nr:signal peptidase I [Cryobacterium lyxosi]